MCQELARRTVLRQSQRHDVTSASGGLEAYVWRVVVDISHVDDDAGGRRDRAVASVISDDMQGDRVPMLLVVDGNSLRYSSST